MWEWFIGNCLETWDTAFLKAAIISRELGFYERSMEIVDQALDKIPDNPWVYDNQARCLAYFDNYEDAINSWEQAINFSEDQTQKDLFSSMQLECEKDWSQVSATITSTAGNKLNGYFSFKDPQQSNSHKMCVYMDSIYLVTHQCQKIKDSNKFIFSVPLPASAFDGKPHVFSVSLEDFPLRYAYYIDQLPTIQTSFQYLRTSALERNYPSLARVSSYRYESLRYQLDNPAHNYKDLSQFINNISLAHKVILEGYENRKKFPKLTLPKQETPDISIIIPAHNQFESTYHCIASIILSYNEISYEVIIVDDTSSDSTKDLENYIENARVIRNDTNLGFLKSCNKAAQTGRGKYLVFLNNDTEVTSGWLDELVSIFRRFDKVGLVGAKLLYPDGSLQEAGGIVWNNGQPWNLGKGDNAFSPKFNYVRQVDYVSGAALMIETEIWNKVNGFSEEFAPAYYEDTDLAFKVRKAGYKTVYCPFSEVIHFEGMSNGRDTSTGIKQHQVINSPKFRAKWINDYYNNGSVGHENVRLNMDRYIHYRVLVIDYSTPKPDQEAGGHATVQEIHLLQSLGCKVSFLPNNFAHEGKYTEFLQKMGVECFYAPYYTSIDKLFEQHGQEFDIFYVIRYNVAERYIDLMRKNTKAKIIFNNADLHFLRELRTALNTDNKDLSGPLATRDREFSLMRKVDVILSYNKTEHAIITSHNLRQDNIFCTPWVVQIKKPKKTFAEREGITFLGGYRHPPNVEAMEHFVTEVMPLLREKQKGIKLHIYGSNLPKSLEELASDDIILEGFVESLATVFENCRVFVVPLLSGAGLKGKVIDCLSYGVPSVLSPIAAEGTNLNHGINTMIAEDPEEWVTNIIQLYNDETMWNKISENSLSLAKELYSFKSGQRQMQKVLNYLEMFTSERNISSLYQTTI